MGTYIMITVFQDDTIQLGFKETCCLRLHGKSYVGTYGSGLGQKDRKPGQHTTKQEIVAVKSSNYDVLYYVSSC
jgi:hypothetical protein